MKKIKINSKKGNLLLESETVKIVLAVMCIVILIILAYKLYTLFFKKSAFEQAKESLEQLVGRINSMKDGQTSMFTITGPLTWRLLLFNKGDILPTQCYGFDNCLCICEGQGYENCDKSGVCKNININSEMSYYCFGMTNQYKCFQITLKDIPLKKENGILYIGDEKNFIFINKIREVLNQVDPKTNKNVDQLLAEFVVDSNNNNFKNSINFFMADYIQTNIPEISSWYLTIKSEDGKILGIFGYYNSYVGSDSPEIPSFRHNYDEIKKYGEFNYSFRWEFNLNKE